MAGHAAAVAGEAQVFLRGGLHIDLRHIQSQHPCNIVRHRRNVIFQLGPLSNHRHIDISHFVAGIGHFLTHNPQKFQRIRTFIGRICIGKMLADVSQGSSAQKAVGDSMEQHICVTVAQEALLKGNLYAAQNQIPAFHQFMHIVTVSDSHFLSSRSISAIFRSMGVVTLMLHSSPSTILTLNPISSTAEQSSVMTAPS